MFAMETGEDGTPRDKVKISRAQREIDNLGTPTGSNNNANWWQLWRCDLWIWFVIWPRYETVFKMGDLAAGASEKCDTEET